MEKLEIEDLLIAILSQLPRKSIFRFMCVSKRWNNILNDPFFFHSYIIARKRLISSNRPLAFIEINSTIKRRLGCEWYCNQKDYQCHLASGQQLSMKILPIIDQTNDHEIEQVPNELGYFIGCSEGLILCGHHFKTYNILNPVKRTCVSLPLPEVQFFPSMGLVCEENINNNGCEPVSSFKVICADVNNEYTNTLSIQTYYSNTGKWTNSTLIATGTFNLQAFRHPFVFNGVFHWFSWDKTLAIYDSNGRDNHVQLITLPNTFGDNERIFSTFVTRSSSDNVLWFGINKFTVLEFWMLPKDQNGGYKRSTTIRGTEWTLVHKITHESVRQDVGRVHDGTIDYKKSRFVHLEWMIPGNPFVAVLRLRGLICLFNLELETKLVELVPFDDHHIADIESTKCYCSWYPYMAPRSLSPYAV